MWATTPDGAAVPPFRWIRHGPRWRWNMGEPRFADVIAFDTDPITGPLHCRHCRARIFRWATHVRGGRIADVVGYATPAEDDAADVLIVGSDGVPRPMPDWSEPQFEEFGGTAVLP